eukprot:jgi/Mesen1/10599/ME000086S10136
MHSSYVAAERLDASLVSSTMSDSDSSEFDVFEIPAKTPKPEALLRWRKATLVLNATRRFRYTANLKSPGTPTDEQSLSAAALRFRTGGHALLAVQRFKEAGARARSVREDPEEELSATKGFLLSLEDLVGLHDDSQMSALDTLGGVAGVARALRTSPENGINGMDDDLEKRKETFGTNTYPEKPVKGFWVFAWEACQDTTLIILMVCAVVSLISGMVTEDPAEGWYDGAGIGFAVILVILVTAVSDYRQSLQFRDLNKEKANIKLQVTRGGRRIPVSIYDLVVGDVVPLSIGDQVPADGILVEGHSLVIDESSMTGESNPRHKDAHHPFLLSGCKVSDGFGSMLVTGVGINTEWGRVMTTLVEEDGSETPLQVRLNGVATAIGQAGLAVATLVFVILIVRYFVNFESKKASKVIKDLVDIFSIAVTIVVVAVPEGLPLAVTLTLAYSMRKMMADKALVRQLAACETMGCATNICSDKTGTLTLNQMTVVRTWMAGAERDFDLSSVQPATVETIKEALAQNSNASVFLPPGGAEPEVTGSPTEKALIVWALQMGMDFDTYRHNSEILQVEAFNSAKKRAGVAVKLPSGEVRAHWKGAAEIVLGQCTQWRDADGSNRPLSEAKRAEVTGVINDMAEHSLRCIALGYRPVQALELPKPARPDDETVPEEWKFPEDQLIFLGVLGIKDPCRPNVPEAVARCQEAGVKVRMVTGDNANTARAIAKECGILTEHGIVIEGKDFRVMPPAEQMAIIPSIDVMARSSPTDKHTLVKLLRQMGEVVAVTGDGTNDAPALHEADIGLSMGISGTEVAKESSDIVILDDNFESIVKASKQNPFFPPLFSPESPCRLHSKCSVVRWGRSVYANIQKFIQFQLTVNVVALCLNFVAACASGDVPLTAVQLLWVNLIMDTLGALALATEAPTDELMTQKPVGRKEPLITNIMWRNIFGQAVYQLAVLLTLNFAGKSILGLDGPNAEREKTTFIFNAFVFCQLFNEINARKPNKVNVFEGLFGNRLFCSIIVISVIFQALIVEFLKKFASTVRLSWHLWVISVIIGSISMPLAALVKLIPVPARPFLEILWPRKRRRNREADLNVEMDEVIVPDSTPPNRGASTDSLTKRQTSAGVEI